MEPRIGDGRVSWNPDGTVTWTPEQPPAQEPRTEVEEFVTAEVNGIRKYVNTGSSTAGLVVAKHRSRTGRCRTLKPAEVRRIAREKGVRMETQVEKLFKAVNTGLNLKTAGQLAGMTGIGQKTVAVTVSNMKRLGLLRSAEGPAGFIYYQAAEGMAGKSVEELKALYNQRYDSSRRKPRSSQPKVKHPTPEQPMVIVGLGEVKQDVAQILRLLRKERGSVETSKLQITCSSPMVVSTSQNDLGLWAMEISSSGGDPITVEV